MTTNLFDKEWELASELFEAGCHKEAFDKYQYLVESGYDYALHNFAYCFDEGLGVAQNKKEALRLYRRSFLKGHSGSAINIAIYYRDRENWSRAREWFKRAINIGDGDAALELAKLYARSKRRPEREKALKYAKMVRLEFEKGQACEASVEEAEELIGKFSGEK